MGSNAAATLNDELHHESAPEHSGVEERGRLQPSLSRAPTMPLGCDSGDMAEDLPASMPWCVDHGDFLEAMSTVSLWEALESGELPHATPVWREGLECWTPASDVRALYWTVSQRPPAYDEAGAAREAPGELESTGPLSFALTPDDLRAVAPRWTLTGSAAAVPESTREHRAEAATLHSRPRLNAPAYEETPAPISLNLPPSFPGVPMLGFDAPASAPVTLPSGPQLLPRPTRALSAECGPASGLWTRVVQRARVRRDTLPVAAGSAIAASAIGLMILNAMTPPSASFAAARIGFAPSAAIVAARVAHVAPPEVALPEAAPPEVAPPALGRLAGAALPEPPLPEPPDQAATAPAARPVPVDRVDRRERGQYRLRRGRIENGVTRGFHRSGS